MILAPSLRKRIGELQTSLEQSKAELAIYEQALALELKREEMNRNGHEIPYEKEVVTPVSTFVTTAAVEEDSGDYQTTPDLVLSVVKRFRGGATPKAIQQVLVEHGLEDRKHLVYAALYALLKKGVLKRREDRYFTP